MIPERPSETAVWIDGEWRWRRRRWFWVYGRWVEPPEQGARFARAALRFDQTGQLFFAPGAWRTSDGKTLSYPEARDRAATTTGDVVEETGVLEEVGPNRETMRRRRRRRRPRRPELRCSIEEACPIGGSSGKTVEKNGPLSPGQEEKEGAETSKPDAP
jgi:hypothetical protein